MNRWLRYGLCGFGFGVLDFGFMELVGLAARSRLNSAGMVLQVISAIILYGAVWLVWLLPLVPTVLQEWHTSASKRNAALSGALVWALAMLGYYLAYAAYLLLIGAPNLEHLLLRNRAAPDYWWVTSHFIMGVVVGQFFEWIIPALVLGTAAGWLVVIVHGKWAARLQLNVKGRRMDTQ